MNAGDASLVSNSADEGIAVVGSTEAHQAAAQGADLFVAVGGSLGGSKTASRPDWAVRDFSQLTKSLKRHQIAFIGSGTNTLPALDGGCFAFRFVVLFLPEDDSQVSLRKEAI